LILSGIAEQRRQRHHVPVKESISFSEPSETNTEMQLLHAEKRQRHQQMCDDKQGQNNVDDDSQCRQKRSTLNQVYTWIVCEYHIIRKTRTHQKISFRN